MELCIPSHAVIDGIRVQAFRWLITISACGRTRSNRTRGSRFSSTAATIAMIVFFACRIARSAMLARCWLGGTNCTSTSMSGSANSSFTDVDTSLSRHWYFGRFPLLL